MLFPYIIGLFLGTQINERSKNSYYHHKEKIVNLEIKIKEYERLLGKLN
jgi:hypothetical protein